jgi:hypothetical protein
MAFKIAASQALKKYAQEASPCLLEPMMKVEVVTPEDYMGDAMVFRRSFGHLSPDDDGLYVSPFLTTMTDGRGAWLSG